MTQDDKEKPARSGLQPRQLTPGEKIIQAFVTGFIVLGILWLIWHFYPAKVQSLLRIFGLVAQQ